MVGTNLRAGVARVDITPPVPMDCVGFIRMAAPAIGVASPLNATAIVLDDVSTDTRVAIVAFDLVGIGIEQGRRIRKAIGVQLNCPPENVMLNYSHTHAAPHPFDDHPKLGGTISEITESNWNYIDSLLHRITSAAFQASQEMYPVRVSAGSGQAEGIAVNRRERLPDGRTVLGWNPEGKSDPEVAVVRVDRLDGSPLAVIVNFACHPVVLGPEYPYISSDFPGVVRQVVERTTGAMCLFLQGAAGNVLPLEGFCEQDGPEVAFGERVALEALAAFSRIRTTNTEIERLDHYGSVTPVILYRHRPVDPQPNQPLAGVTRTVRFPLKTLPTLEEVETELVMRRKNYDDAVAAGAAPSALNPLEYHVKWAETAVQKLVSGTAETYVDGVLQVVRIGDIAFTAVPGEVFNEIGLAVKDRSVAPFTVFCGYSNEYIAYFPTACEYPYGGYEPGYSHHNSTRLEQVGPECEEIIVSNLLEMTSELFS